MERAQEIRVADAPRCPFCHDAVEPSAAMEACPACMAWHHLECWNEHDTRCAACGGTRTAPPPDHGQARRDLITGVVFAGLVLFGVLGGGALGAAFFEGLAGAAALALIFGTLGGRLGYWLAPVTRAGRRPTPPPDGRPRAPKGD